MATISTQLDHFSLRSQIERSDWFWFANIGCRLNLFRETNFRNFGSPRRMFEQKRGRSRSRGKRRADSKKLRKAKWEDFICLLGRLCVNNRHKSLLSAISLSFSLCYLNANIYRHIGFILRRKVDILLVFDVIVVATVVTGAASTGSVVA